jgi:hypothetical protein
LTRFGIVGYDLIQLRRCELRATAATTGPGEFALLRGFLFAVESRSDFGIVAATLGDNNMFAVILTVVIHSITCFAGGAFFCMAMKIAKTETGWNALTSGEKNKVGLYMMLMSATPAFFTSLLLWYAVHKMV